jgi:N-glycosylase/DNA lyase
MKTDQILELYQIKKSKIKKRLENFKEVLNQSDEKIFAELAFCICTPQSRAFVCWNIISSLTKNNLLFTGGEKEIRSFMNPIRFADNKTSYIVKTREAFTENEKLKIKGKISSFENAFKLRNWLVKNIKGLGMKEASHFIRNIGFDYKNQLSILDRHILKNLRELGVINKIPKSLTRKKYLEIESKMIDFSRQIKVPMYELDMLLWSKETGKIFK